MSSINTIPQDVVRAGRVTFNKANYTVPNNAAYVAQVGVFTPGTDAGGQRVVTLPNATTYGVGKMITIADESYSLRPWFRLMLTPASGQALNGVVNGTYPMIWAGQKVFLQCTGTSWEVVACNIIPTPWAAENPNHGRGVVCMETDFGDYQSGQNGPGYRAIGANGSILAVNNNVNNVMRVLAMTAGNAAGHGCRLVTTGNSGMNEARSRKSGEWCEWSLATLETGGNGNFSVHEFGITSYVDGSPVADADSGVYIRFDNSVNSTNWIAYSANGGTRTGPVDTGISYLATSASYMRFGIHLVDGTSAAHCYIGDTLVASFSTNVPDGTRLIAPTCMTRYATGVGRSVFLDRLRYQHRIADVASRLY